jgi:acetyl/propionyl-CoA carboxylase alpha subunit
MVTGLDLVAMQIRLAGGMEVPDARQEQVEPRGHAIECRLYAERPAKMFMPSPGPLLAFSLPEATRHLRIDSGFREGDTVSPHYDPLLAKVVAHGGSRQEAIERMLEALGAVRIDGIQANVDFLRKVLDHAEFRAGRVHTGFVDAHKAGLLS